MSRDDFDPNFWGNPGAVSLTQSDQGNEQGSNNFECRMFAGESPATEPKQVDSTPGDQTETKVLGFNYPPQAPAKFGPIGVAVEAGE